MYLLLTVCVRTLRYIMMWELEARRNQTSLLFQMHFVLSEVKLHRHGMIYNNVHSML